MDDALSTSDLDLGAVGTRDQLAALLRQVYVRADKPSLRALEARTRHTATPLSKTAVAEMLNGVRLPRKAMMVSFLRACGVQDDGMELWQRTWERVVSGEEGQHLRRATNSWQFSDSGPMTLICAQLPASETSDLADITNPNYTELLSYADLDALVELYGHIRAENPAINVFFKQSSKFVPSDLSGHVVLIGGVDWNEITARVSEMSQIPIRQTPDPVIDSGDVFMIDRDGKEQTFRPIWGPDHGELTEDIGLIARTSNPLNSNRSLTICNGIHSRGVLGAARTLTDPHLRESNENYITENFADPSTFAVLMRVSVIGGRTMTPDFRAANCVLYRWPSGPGDKKP